MVRCRLRILDSFGTEPEFNYAEYKEGEKLKVGWGKADVLVRQMMTMFRKYTCCFCFTLANHKGRKQRSEPIRMRSNACSQYQTRENACEQVTIGFGFSLAVCTLETD